jgi:hypothetical protein
MYGKESNINSDIRNDDDDEQLLELTTASDQHHERILLNIVNEPTTGINSTDDRDSDTDLLIDETQIEPLVTNTIICSKAPARYIIAIWAFFGFFCLYAMRVNMSVAIVAMVSIC